VKRWLANLLTSLALRLYPSARVFDPADDDEPLDELKWAALVILHAEAVHGCQHTDQARRELGLAGPRGEVAS
jgi:hypothetical protein